MRAHGYCMVPPEAAGLCATVVLLRAVRSRDLIMIVICRRGTGQPRLEINSFGGINIFCFPVSPSGSGCGWLPQDPGNRRSGEVIIYRFLPVFVLSFAGVFLFYPVIVQIRHKENSTLTDEVPFF
jgi:hypothetical protein